MFTLFKHCNYVYTIQCFQNPDIFSGFSCTLLSCKQCGGLMFYWITLVLESFWEEHGRTCLLWDMQGRCKVKEV